MNWIGLYERSGKNRNNILTLLVQTSFKHDYEYWKNGNGARRNKGTPYNRLSHFNSIQVEKLYWKLCRRYALQLHFVAVVESFPRFVTLCLVTQSELATMWTNKTFLIPCNYKLFEGLFVNVRINKIDMGSFHKKKFY